MALSFLPFEACVSISQSNLTGYQLQDISANVIPTFSRVNVEKVRMMLE